MQNKVNLTLKKPILEREGSLTYEQTDTAYSIFNIDSNRLLQ